MTRTVCKTVWPAGSNTSRYICQEQRLGLVNSHFGRNTEISPNLCSEQNWYKNVSVSLKPSVLYLHRSKFQGASRYITGLKIFIPKIVKKSLIYTVIICFNQIWTNTLLHH